MLTLNAPFSALFAAAILSAAILPAASHAATDPAGVTPAARTAAPIGIASPVEAVPGGVAAGPSVMVAGYYAPRRARRRAAVRRPLPRRYRRAAPRRAIYRAAPRRYRPLPRRRVVYRRPPVRVVRPPVRVIAPPVVYPAAYYAPLRPCAARVVRVRRNGRWVVTRTRCAPYAYGPAFRAGVAVRY